MGFGFDAKTNDFKIINFVSMYDPTFESYSFQDVEDVVYQKEVYSLSTDSWRKVDGPQCFIFEDQRDTMTYTTGMSSWLAYVDYISQRDLFVLSFDMSDEVFLKTLLPDNVIGVALYVLNESIAMVAEREVEGQTLVFYHDIWLLLKVGVKDSWAKLFTIEPFADDVCRPLGFWKNDTMFWIKNGGQLVLYDPSTKQITYLQIHGDGDNMQLVIYMETLVSVKGGNEFEE
ncbi:hypothetical protein FH972_000495 [Carpinus fangiana]|uniref:F-box associated beta-propeller type 1 domain-containing protein n=1 Tax=Carpinus fangiana TaxID=176857 RepID=A0A5N6Q987_9ROSI|nr:hypothetical protein FH972_000495 [Carpinus fangiana]